MNVAVESPIMSSPWRFDFLMGLYAENHQRLTRLFAPGKLALGAYVSCVGDGLDIHVQIQKRHPYTLDLELTYGFVDACTGQRAPSAQLRVYTDARLAEVLHCHPGQHLWQILGPFPPARTVLQYRLRMNSFLSRWLEYLHERGHGVDSLGAPMQLVQDKP